MAGICIVSDLRKESTAMRSAKVILSLIMIVGVYAQADAFTLTFDDIPAGEVWREYYWQQYGVYFGYFYLADHSESSWGPPRSGINVLRCSTDNPLLAVVKFNHPDTGNPFSIYSLGAYFSTEPGVVVRMFSRDLYGNLVASVDIGSPGESWNNVYAEINSPEGSIRGVRFEGVSSPDALLHFAADDMTIVPVPEPSSLLALASGFLGLSGLALRRRRN